MWKRSKPIVENALKTAGSEGVKTWVKWILFGGFMGVGTYYYEDYTSKVSYERAEVFSQDDRKKWNKMKRFENQGAALKAIQLSEDDLDNPSSPQKTAKENQTPEVEDRSKQQS